MEHFCWFGYLNQLGKYGSVHSIAFHTHCRAQKIFEFHLARQASNPQILLARGTSPLAQVFKLINNSLTQKWKSNYMHVLM